MPSHSKQLPSPLTIGIPHYIIIINYAGTGPTMGEKELHGEGISDLLKGMRRRRCHACDGCTRQDCGTCQNCNDM